MNYIAEINAFYAKQAAAPLAANTQALWHLMMNISNRAGWPRTVIIPESVLTGTLGISHGAFIQARKELIQAGLILHIQRPGRQAPVYLIKTIAYNHVHMSDLSVLKLST